MYVLNLLFRNKQKKVFSSNVLDLTAFTNTCRIYFLYNSVLFQIDNPSFFVYFFFDCLEPECTYCFEDARSQPSIKQILSTLKSCSSTQELLAAQHMLL